MNIFFSILPDSLGSSVYIYEFFFVKSKRILTKSGADKVLDTVFRLNYKLFNLSSKDLRYKLLVQKLLFSELLPINKKIFQMCAEALSCYVYPEAPYFTASFIGMSRSVCSLFQLGVLLLSCPRHAFGLFVSALFPTFLTALLSPSSQVLCDVKEHGSPPLHKAQYREGSVAAWAGLWGSGTAWGRCSTGALYGCTVPWSLQAPVHLALGLNKNLVVFLLIMAWFKWVPLGDQTAHHINYSIPAGHWCLGLLFNNELNSEQLWWRSKLANFYPLPCSHHLWSFFLSHSLTLQETIMFFFSLCCGESSQAFWSRGTRKKHPALSGGKKLLLSHPPCHPTKANCPLI